MMKSRWLRALPFAAVIGVAVYLASSSFNEALTYYVTAKEFQSAPEKYHGQLIKIAGWVEPGSIQRDPADPLKVSFIVQENDVRIPVAYTGIVPDTFKDNAEVVATGRWDGTIFRSTEILAKCASKYTEKLEEDAT